MHTWQMFNVCYNSCLSDSVLGMACTLGMTLDLRIQGVYMLVLVSMNLTLVQGHSRSTKANIQCWIISTAKQATSNKVATTVGLFFFTWPRLWKRLYGLTTLFQLNISLHSSIRHGMKLRRVGVVYRFELLLLLLLLLLWLFIFGL